MKSFREWGEHLQSVAGYLGLALVFVSGGALREGFNCYFLEVFGSLVVSFLQRGASCWAIILWGLDNFLIFPNFLRS